jgi:hypothetical protein
VQDGDVVMFSAKCSLEIGLADKDLVKQFERNDTIWSKICPLKDLLW